jgi:tRNA dimethylallyltransferase
LIIVVGPTAAGKTSHAIDLARRYNTEIVSCDSRQFYRELRIGVARPSDEELAAAPHHFIACRPVAEPYNVFEYERDALSLIHRLFNHHHTVVAVGGSGLYIDALRQGVASLPDPTPELRAELQAMPIEEKRARLRLLDPDYYARVDLRNPVRLQRALEVCLMTGRPYSQVLASQKPAEREFDIELCLVSRDTATLRDRINRRVDTMMAEGLLDEVAALSPLRHLQTLRTVGYRELFPVVDGTDTLDHAVDMIKLNTWHYARKQLTWLRRYGLQC